MNNSVEDTKQHVLYGVCVAMVCGICLSIRTCRIVYIYSEEFFFLSTKYMYMFAQIGLHIIYIVWLSCRYGKFSTVIMLANYLFNPLVHILPDLIRCDFIYTYDCFTEVFFSELLSMYSSKIILKFYPRNENMAVG